MLPGNHDLNIVDRANPARMDLPTSPNRPLRQIRCLSAMNAVQGRHVRVVDLAKACLGGTLEEALRPHEAALERFADVARPILSKEIPEVWARVFPMVVPPAKKDGLGIILLNSNADTHFSFTNALGMVSAEQMRGLDIARAEYPACVLGDRAPPPRRRISVGRQGTVGADRHRSDQRQLVRAQPQASGGPRHPHARPSPHRLDRPYRRPADRLRAVAGDGGYRRYGHRLLYPQPGDRRRRQAQAARARAHRRPRRTPPE